MSLKELILVTGATGFLGSRLTLTLLDRHPEAALALIIRDRPGQTAQQRADLVVRPQDRHRVQVISGDVTQPYCGLTPAIYQRLSAEATRIIHGAAAVRFDLSLRQARSINVEGTRRLLDLATRAPMLRSFTHLSTAYVAGQRTGLIRETELAVGQRYRNTYEQTKAEAEALVRDRLNSIPAVILRPSALVSDSSTGVASGFDTLCQPLKLYARGLWRTIPGHPDAVLDLVPADYVAKSITHLAFDRAALGKTVHLCAGQHGSTTMQQVAQRAATYFNRPEPRYIDPKFFFSTIRPLLSLVLWGQKRSILQSAHVYRDYLSIRMQFDITQAEQLLVPAGIYAPTVLNYLDGLFRYCVASDWGRKAAEVQ